MMVVAASVLQEVPEGAATLQRAHRIYGDLLPRLLKEGEGDEREASSPRVMTWMLVLATGGANSVTSIDFHPLLLQLLQCIVIM